MHWCSGRSAVVTGTGSTEIAYLVIHQVFPGSSVGKNPSAKQETRDLALISGKGRSPGEGNGNSFQSSCLENPSRLQSDIQRGGHD